MCPISIFNVSELISVVRECLDDFVWHPVVLLHLGDDEH